MKFVPRNRFNDFISIRENKKILPDDEHQAEFQIPFGTFNLIPLLYFFLLGHVTHPNEKSNEANHDKQFIKPGTHPVHD